MRWFGIVNPAAGRRKSALDEVLLTANELSLDATFEESIDGADIVDRVSSAVGEGYRRFVAVGGDGTAHLVLNGLMTSGSDERCTLAIVPNGSGGDFVRTFGHEWGVYPGLERLVSPELYTVDVGRATGSFGSIYFLNAMNIGVGAASAAIANRFYGWTGAWRYRMAFWLALGRFRAGQVDVTTDHHNYKGEAINVVIANGQFFGGGMNIAPGSSLIDGKMDVQIFLGPRLQAFVIMPRLLVGTHLTHKGVQGYSGTSIRINVPGHWPVEADGEIIGQGSVEVEVLPQAVDFVI